MARKLPRLQRVLDAPALASVAYGEVASSLYFALGIVALHALGLTPVVLAIVGVLFLVVTLSYAEGTTSIGETGGAATFVRVAFNDLAGFITGWALFLDYLIVIALSALFFPHYLGLAIGMHSIAQRPGDVIVGCVVIVAIALVRLLRRTRLYSFSLVVPLLDLVTQLLLVLLGFAFLFSPSALTRGLSRRDAAVVAPDRVRAAARVPRVHRARDGGEPRRGDAPAGTRPAAEPLPRDRRGRGRHGADRARRRSPPIPAPNGTTQLGTTWLRAPLMGVVYALGPHVAYWVERVLRVYVGLTGALILLVAAATSNSGFGRLAYSLAEHGQLPRRFGRLSRRSLHSPETVVAAALISIVLLALDGVHDESGRIPREPLQLRRPRRVHRRATRGHEAPLQQAGPRAPIPGAALDPDSGRGRPAADGRRCARDDGDLRRGDGDAHRRALRRPDLARRRRRRLPPRPPRPRHRPARARRAASRRPSCRRRSSRRSSCR